MHHSAGQHLNPMLSTGKCPFTEKVFQLQRSCDQRGLVTRSFAIAPKYGTGHVELYQFHDLILSVSYIQLHRELQSRFVHHGETLVLSWLINGQQLISIDAQNKPLIYENQQTYWCYYPSMKGSIRYLASQKWVEVKLVIRPGFIQRHNLHYLLKEATDPQKRATGKKQVLTTEQFRVLMEIIHDQSQEATQRIRLESRILELLTLTFDAPETEPFCKSVYLAAGNLKQLLQAKRIIQSEMEVQYTVAELAQRVGLDEGTLKRTFKKTFHQSLFDYSTDLRIKKAKELLQFSTQPIYLIAEEVGYKNATHFTSAFRKNTGISPKTFRNAQV